MDIKYILSKGLKYGRFWFLWLFTIVYCLSVCATISRTIHVATAGTLPNLISESEKYTIEELTLTGELNGTDFRLFRDMAGCNYLGDGTSGQLKVLDISETRVVIGGERYVDTDHLPGWGGSFRYTVDKNDVLPQWIFAGCKFTSVSIPNSVTSIGYSAFSGCRGLTSISIPNSVTSIGSQAFYYCSGLTSIKVESGNNVYDSRNNCNAIIKKSTNELIAGCKNTVIPNSVKSIGYYAFGGCSSLTSMSIPNSVTSIGGSAFEVCSGLISLSIPNSVTSIGNYAFYNCRGLKDVISEIKTPFEISENVFSVYSTAKLTVPIGTKSAYQSTNYWNKFSNIVESTSESNDDFGKVANVVDLGLSVKWASWNIGASKIGDYGGLYGAGDPTGKKTSTNVSDYYFNDGGSICGTEYDLAHVKWGDLWRMPKWSELEELKTKCTWTNGEVDGVKGSWVKGPNGNSIFLPWAGNRKGTSTFSGKGSYGYYWSGDMGVSLHSYGYKDLDIGSGGVNQTDGAENYWGQSIRPVYGDSNNSSNTSTKRTIHVATAGTLPNLISESEKYTIEELTLTGELNGTDFRLLRDMAGNNYLGKITSGKLRFLDLSGARIIAGGEKYLDASSIEVEKHWFVGQNCHYDISNNDEIPKYIFTGCSLSLILPNSVTSIGTEAFQYCFGLNSITIPNSVKSIGPYAFWDCTGLTSITIPNSVTRIENCTFYGCSGLTSITIPNSITSIGGQAFSGCTGINSITIPNSVTSIGSSAFRGCTALTSITIPNSVTNIGYEVFDSNLSSLNVASGNPKYDSRNGCNAIIETATNKLVLGLNNSKIPNTITTIGERAFAYCSDLTSITIPNSVTTIGENAFQGCGSLSSITIPSSVNDIGSYAFHGTAWYNNQSDGLIYIGKNAYTYKGTMPENSKITIKDGTLALSGSIFKDSSGLTSITIPNSVINIGSNAFEGCSGLTSITIPNSVTIIRDGTFKNCSKLTSITIPNTVTNIGNNVFEDCNGLTSITIPNSITRIGEYAFHNCSSLTSITIPNSVSEICPATFAECSSLTSITIPTSVTNIGGSAFAFCNSLTSITIPNSVTNIGSAAFVFCNNLTSITIPNSVTSIGEGAFVCSGLTSIGIPNSVTSIGDFAFDNCNDLKDIILEKKIPFEINENVFSVYSTATLIVPNGTKSAYQATAGWDKFTNIVEAEADNTFGKVADFVDLGLSVKWASWNIGASKVGDYGGLYGAGDPTGQKTSTNYSDYYFKNGESICNTDYDLAHVKWGEKWRMPTFEELKELRNKCTWSKGEVDGVQGSWVKGPNGNSIFLPCAGYREGNTIKDKDDKRYGFYWSGDMGASSYEHGYKDLDIYLGGVLKMDGGENYMGQSIRPVYGDWNNGSNSSTKRTIHVVTAGTLPNLISESEKYTIEELTLTGELNGTDFRLLRDMAGCNYLGDETSGQLKVLDISETRVVIGGERYVDTDHLPGWGGSFRYTVDKNDVLPQWIFASCKFTSVSIPNSVTNIGDYAFSDCRSLTSISIPNSVTSIGEVAFYDCRGLTSISIPNSVTSIGNSAFYSCRGLTSIIIPNSVTSIGNYAFSSCSGLTSISIPNSVTSIGNSAFSSCSGLTSISIPNSVTSIGDYAFSGCSGFKDVISEIKTPFEISENVFSVYSNAKLTVPSGTKSAYQSTNYWNKFTNIVEQETETIIQGDVNGDQEVNVSDIVEVVNYINNNASAIFLKNNADLNGDGEVNVTDIVWMVNIIMSGQSGAARKTSNRAGVLTDGDCLTIEDLTMNAGETKQVSVLLNNPDKKYTAFQFDLTLPDGVTIVRNSNGKLMASLVTDRIDDHTLSVAEMGDNIYRLLAFSMSNAEFYGTSGALVNMTLQADANLSSCPQDATLKSQVFTATDGVQYKWSDKAFSIHVNASENTGIDETLLTGQKSGLIKVYTLTGLLLFSASQVDFPEQWQHLPSGVYIVNGQKMIKSDDSKYRM